MTDLHHPEPPADRPTGTSTGASTGGPVDPPTDPGSGFYGAVPAGWTAHPADQGRVRWWQQAPGWLLVAVATLLVVAVLLGIRLLAAHLTSPDTSTSTSPTASPGPGAPGVAALPTPTLSISRGGYRYSVGVGPFHPASTARGAVEDLAPPGRHFLTATVVVRNDQLDRPAPALLGTAATPTVRVALGGVAFLAPSHGFGFADPVSDCDNDPRNQLPDDPRTAVYPGLPTGSCVVRANLISTDPGTGSADDATLAPGATTAAELTTTALPDQAITTATAAGSGGSVTAWLADPAAATPSGGQVFERIP